MKFVIHYRKPSWKIHYKKPTGIIRFSKPSMKLKMSSKRYFRLRNACCFIYDNLFLILAIIWAIIIFGFSNQDAATSGAASSSLYEKLTQESFVFTTMFTFINIRKWAHMFLYFVLGIFLFLHFRCRVRYSGILTLLLCYIYACSDEIHQLFVNGRGGLVSDTFIDLIVASFGVIIISFFMFVMWKINQRKYDY